MFSDFLYLEARGEGEEGWRRRVPAVWISLDKPFFSQAVPAKKGASRLDKPFFSGAAPTPIKGSLRGRISLSSTPGAALKRSLRQFGAPTCDLDFMNFPRNRLCGRTSSLRPSSRRSTSPSSGPNPRRRAYPPTNGSAGGKQPNGKPGLGSPLLSLSAAVR